MSFASHELRNPVTAVRGYASLMLEGGAGTLDADARRNVEKISGLAGDVLQLIEQYLAKSKAELGKIKYESQLFDLAAATREITEAMRPQAEAKGLAVRLSGVSALLPVRADLGKVKEVIRNIVDNAIKYTPAGTVTVSSTRRNSFAQVRVTDTGVGLSAETLPQLFSKFSRADSHAVNVHSSGIGLYLGRIFIEAMGGRIYAESPGEGKRINLRHRAASLAMTFD